jgi:hypothetical protein
MKRFLWIAFFAAAILLAGDTSGEATSPPLGWWLVAIGFAFVWQTETPSAAFDS